MPLDTLSTYTPQTLLRTDGRRWNELRHITGSISTQSSSSDGSSQWVVGNTVVVCTVVGPREGRTPASTNSGTAAQVETSLTIAPFAQTERRQRPQRSDRRILELAQTITSTFSSHLLTHLYPRSTISISLHVLSLDGGLLAACINAVTLALVDAGVAMPSLIAATSSGVIVDIGSEVGDDGPAAASDPVLDLNNAEEMELPFLTVATVAGPPHLSHLTDGGGGRDQAAREEDKVAALMLDSRVQVGSTEGQQRLEAMLAVGIDGCKQVRGIMDGVVRKHGRKVLSRRK